MSALDLRYEAVWDGLIVSVSVRVVVEVGDWEDITRPYAVVTRFACRAVTEVEDRLEYHGFRLHKRVRQVSAGVPFEVKKL